MTGRRRNPVKTLFKVERLDAHSVIIIKSGCVMTSKKNMQLLAGELVKKELRDIVILTLDSLDDFHALSEEQMSRLGWIRKEKEDGPKPA